MERRKRSRVLPSTSVEGGEATISGSVGCCAVCAARDARLLVMTELEGGAAVTLCGSHALMHSRMTSMPRTVGELRSALCERRENARRADGAGDELAERLTAAFTRERRNAERRAG